MRAKTLFAIVVQPSAAFTRSRVSGSFPDALASRIGESIHDRGNRGALANLRQRRAISRLDGR